ncbi:hypothetical protein FQZ97_972470 [compost metagenome]
MVEGAFVVHGGGKPGLAQQGGDLPGQFGRSGGRILHGVERRRESMEVMPGLRLGSAAEHQAITFPMGGDNQYRRGARQARSQRREGRAACAGLQREHGRAVGDVEAG